MAGRNKIEVAILADTAGYQSGLRQASSETENFGGKLGGVLKTGALAAAAGIGVAGAAMYESTKKAMEFQSSMELIQTQAGGSVKEVEHMSHALLEMAGSVGSTPEELSKGLYHVESAGFRGAKALDVLKLAAEGAAVGHSDLEATTTALVAAQRSGIKGLGDMSHSMGSLNAIVGAGNMRMEDLTSALGTGILPSAKAFGLSIKDVGAALATMTSNGIPAVAAASGMKMLFASMAAPTKQAAKLLHSVGLGASDLATTMRSKGLFAALTELQAHLTKAGLTATQQAALLAGAFGKKSSTGLLTLIGNLKDMKKAQDQVGSGASSFGKNWETTQKTSEFATKRFQASIAALEVELGTALLPAVTRAADALSRFVNFLSTSPQVARIASAAMMVFRDVINTLVAAGELLLGFYERHRTATLAVIGVLAGLAVAFTSPITVIIALGVALIELYKHSEQFRNIVNAAFASVQETIAKVMPTIQSIISQSITVIEALWKEFGGTILSFLSATWKNVQQVLTGAFNMIEGIFRLFTDLIHGRWAKLWGDVEQIVRGAWNIVEGEFRQVVNILVTLATLIGTGILKAIGAAMSGLGRLMGRLVDAGVEAVRNLIGAAGAAAKALGLAVLNGIKNGLAALPGVTAKLITDLAIGISAAAGAALAEAAAIGRAIVTGILSGMGNIVASVGSKLAAGVGGAIGWAKNNIGSTADEVTKRDIGVPMAQGVLEGWILGSASLPAKMTQTMQNAIQAARTAITGARGMFGAAWQQLTNDALAAFDAATNRMMGKLEAKRGELTPSEKKLADLQDSHDEAGRQKAIADAKAQVAAAQQAAATPLSRNDGESDADYAARQVAAKAQAMEQEKQAEQALADALYAEQVANLQRKAEAERVAKDKKYANKEKELQADRDLERRHFEQHLAILEEQLEREGATQKQAHDKVVRMLRAYGVTYKQAGLDLGHAFAKGLDESAGAVEKSAMTLAQIVAKYLKTNSPSELGAMSDLPSWWKGFAPALVSGLDTRLIQGTVSAAASPAPASMGGFQGGGDTHFHFPNYVGDKQELIDIVRTEVIRTGRRNGGGALGGFA